MKILTYKKGGLRYVSDKMSMFTNKKVVSFDVDLNGKIGRMMYPNVHFKTVDINKFHPGKYDV